MIWNLLQSTVQSTKIYKRPKPNQTKPQDVKYAGVLIKFPKNKLSFYLSCGINYILVIKVNNVDIKMKRV